MEALIRASYTVWSLSRVYWTAASSSERGKDSCLRGLRKVYPVVTSMPIRSDRSSLAVWNSRFRLLSSVVRFSTEASMVSMSAWTASPVTSRARLRSSSSWAVSSRSWVKDTFSWRMYTLAKSLLAWVTAA